MAEDVANSVYLVVGCPGSGKSWVSDQLQNQYKLVPHDLYPADKGYVEAIKAAAARATKPVLAEVPFSLARLKAPLEAAGLAVHPVFIQEDPDVIAERYRNREGKPIPGGHLTRQDTYRERAEASGAFQGTSDEVLRYLKRVGE
jgi:hypothetical protein